MEDAMVEESEVSGAAEYAHAPVAHHPFVHSVTVARPPPALRLVKSFPPREFISGKVVASSSSSSSKAPTTEAPPEEPAPVPAPTQAAKKQQKKTKRVIIPQSYLEPIMKIEDGEPLSPLQDKWLKYLTALTQNREQFFGDGGSSSLEKYRGLHSMDLLVKAHTDMVAAFQEQLREKGYVSMEVTDDEEEEEGRRVPNVGRKRSRPGVCKTAGGEIRRL